MLAIASLYRTFEVPDFSNKIQEFLNILFHQSRTSIVFYSFPQVIPNFGKPPDCSEIDLLAEYL